MYIKTQQGKFRQYRVGLENVVESGTTEQGRGEGGLSPPPQYVNYIIFYLIIRIVFLTKHPGAKKTQIGKARVAPAAETYFFICDIWPG